MNARTSIFSELRRRNVLRAGVLYVGAVWALAQGIAQLGPFFGAPDWTVRWFIIAATIGFPFWVAFAWFYEFTPQGLKREREIAPDDSSAHATGRKLNIWIFGVMALAIVLLLTNTFVWHRGAGVHAPQPGATAIPDKSVAVLPFTNESSDKDERYFSDGLSEDMITTLSQVAELRVISSASSFEFRGSKNSPAEIGVALGVAHLLTGGVRRIAGQVRITATLLDTSDGSILWSQHYDRPYKDLFKLQDEIAQAVTSVLKAKLLPVAGAVDQSDRPPSGNLAAYNNYLLGNSLGDNGSIADLRRSIGYFDAAIRLDPGYAQAYAMKSGAWTALAGSLGHKQAQDAYAQAQEAADTALTLDQNSVLAHLARGLLLYSREFDWTGAIAEFQRASQLSPNHDRAKMLLGQALASMGQTQRAINLTREALLVDPLNGLAYQDLFLYDLGAGSWDDAERAVRTQMTLEKGNDVLYGDLAMIEIQRGDARTALQEAQRVAAGPWRDIYTAMALQVGGDQTAADGALKNLVEKYASDGPYQIAQVYALRNDPGNVFKWLDRAWAARDPGIQQLLYDPFVLRYRGDPRFAAFCRKIGLPTTTDAKATP